MSERGGPHPSSHIPCPSGRVLAIDPGSRKCGIAVLSDDATVLHREIAEAQDLAGTVHALCERFRPQVILVGNGTGAERARECLAGLPPEIDLVLVDERFSSQEARARYLAENPARGWRRFLPISLRFPESPYDDYVAVLLAERFLSARS